MFIKLLCVLSSNEIWSDKWEWIVGKIFFFRRMTGTWSFTSDENLRQLKLINFHNLGRLVVSSRTLQSPMGLTVKALLLAWRQNKFKFPRKLRKTATMSQRLSLIQTLNFQNYAKEILHSSDLTIIMLWSRIPLKNICSVVHRGYRHP